MDFKTQSNPGNLGKPKIINNLILFLIVLKEGSLLIFQTLVIDVIVVLLRFPVMETAQG